MVIGTSMRRSATERRSERKIGEVFLKRANLRTEATLFGVEDPLGVVTDDLAQQGTGRFYIVLRTLPEPWGVLWKPKKSCFGGVEHPKLGEFSVLIVQSFNELCPASQKYSE